jgi:uroporphyrinogen III methyltransferase/synthase
VYLVGAGPGDRGLITVRGLEALRRADVVVYDHLASPSLLEECGAGCERMYVGKQAGRRALAQERINALLAEHAGRGRTVVRLKGGDPFVFGRGGEEALELARRGIPFAVVPGVTSAAAAAACAGIPLTHRGLVSSATLVTGHEDPGKAGGRVDWDRLGRGAGTLAVYMGVRNLPRITARLLSAGLPPGTPSALIRWGTLNRQQTLTAELGEIASLAVKAGLEPPAVLVVGETVGLRRELRWFENRPLFGRTLVVTRGRRQAPELSGALEELGALVRELPTVAIRPVDEPSALDGAVGELGSYAWVVFTSVNGVEFFFSALERAGLDARALAGTRAAAIGPETAARLREHGVRADLVPGRFTSRALLGSFAARKKGCTGERFLLPGSDIAGDLLPAGLEEMGAEVTRLPVYRNLAPGYRAEEVDEVFGQAPDLVTFTSSSTARNLAAILRSCGREEYLGRIRGACIGPVTAETARGQGIEVALEAPAHTVAGLVRAIQTYFRGKGRP